jgi:predicted ArsR family transcriptional regulator
MTNWFDRLVGGTRGELLTLLRRAERSINELAEKLGISDNAVRMHIASLQRDGMVEAAGVERATGGKPAQRYQLTAEAEELFPKAYAVVFGELVQVLEEEQGRDGVVRLLRKVGARAAGGEGGAALSDGERVERAAAVLRQLGGEVDVERTESGWKILGHGCPLSGVVGEHEAVCSLGEALVGEVTGLRVSECCRRGERPRCAFEISADRGAAPPERGLL